jgi:drug/metabolite transporter (DMT)-like permease
MPFSTNGSFHSKEGHDPEKQTASALQTVDQEGNNHMIGYSLMMVFVVANSMADSSSKILFTSHSNLGVLEMLFLRGVVVMALMVFLVGRQAKHILYDSIPSKMVVPLMLRCTTGVVAYFCMNAAIKNLPIIIVALF